MPYDLVKASAHIPEGTPSYSFGPADAKRAYALAKEICAQYPNRNQTKPYYGPEDMAVNTARATLAEVGCARWLGLDESPCWQNVKGGNRLPDGRPYDLLLPDGRPIEVKCHSPKARFLSIVAGDEIETDFYLCCKYATYEKGDYEPYLMGWTDLVTFQREGHLKTFDQGMQHCLEMEALGDMHKFYGFVQRLARSR